MSTNTLIALSAETLEQAKIVDCYNPNLDEWSELLTLDTERRFFRSVILEEKLILVGGVQDGLVSSVVQSYDFSTGTMTTKQPMKIPRYYHTVAVLSGHLYVISGYDGEKFTNSVERYNSITDEWTDVTPIPTFRGYTGTVVLDDEIYVIGGYTGNYHSNVESYSPVTESWKKCTSMNEKRYAPAAAVIGKFIYVFGGFNSRKVVNTGERYDPSINRWTKIHDANIPRYFCSGCNFNDSMIVAGGVEKPPIASNTVEWYNFKDDQWTAKGSLRTPRAYLDLVEVPWKFIEQTQALKNLKKENN